MAHLNLVGVRPDVSGEAHSFARAYGNGGLVSVSVIRPGGADAFIPPGTMSDAQLLAAEKALNVA